MAIFRSFTEQLSDEAQGPTVSSYCRPITTFRKTNRSHTIKIYPDNSTVRGKSWFSFSPLTNFSPTLLYYTPWKRQKTKGFLTYSRGIEGGMIGLK